MTLIRFEKIYLIFMSVCFKSFDVSHNFSKTTAVVQNRVIWIHLTIYQSMYDSNQFVLKQIKRVSHEEQLLRRFCCLHFEIKCNTVFTIIIAGSQINAAPLGIHIEVGASL